MRIRFLQSHATPSLMKRQSVTRIIFVDDDEIFRELLTLSLLKFGYEVVGVADSSGLYSALIDRPADIVLLDINLMGENGFLIASQLRKMQSTKSLGLIILTSYSGFDKRMEGLESGADIYLTKPVDPLEVNAHIKSLCRRLESNSVKENKDSWFFSHSNRNLITPEGVKIGLTYLETMFLNVITREAGVPVSRKKIIIEGFGLDPLDYDARKLEAIVSRLRKKITKSHRASKPIMVAHSIGYVFSGLIIRH